jgi:hypothetical protein
MGQDVYYKAVRPDLRDFTTGETRLILGEWMPDIQGPLLICARGYHVSTVKTETLISGNERPVWPARLFAVEARDFGNAEGYQCKMVCRSYCAIEELPAWQAFGPNGEEVVRFIESCRHITVAQVSSLRAGAPPHADTVRVTAYNVARKAALTGVRLAARLAAEDTLWAMLCQKEGGLTPLTAAEDAVLGLLVRDLITPEQFDILANPWVSVVGRTWEVT